MVQIKRLIIFVLLGISVLTFSQNESKTNRLFLGFKLSGGSAETDVKSQFSFFDPLEVDNKLLNSWAPSVYLEQRFLESFSFHVGASYMNSNYSFLDISTTNYGYYDAFTTQYKVSNKIKYVETEIGLKKIFLTDQVIRPFLALNFNLSFVDSDSLNLIKSENNTSYQTKLGYVQDKMEGLSPEIGVMLSTSGGGNWIFSVKKHCAFDQ